MARKEKPYRVYRGGRARGPVPKPDDQTEDNEASGLQASPDELNLQPDEFEGQPPETPPEYRPSYRPPSGPRKRRWLRVLLVVLLTTIIVVGAWAALGFLAFRSGVQDANARLDEEAKQALSPQEGSLLSNPTNVLLLGADKGPNRDGRGRADGIVLVRTDPDNHRIVLLSIPRDLRVEVPGAGPDKINAAYSIGGPALAIETVERTTGLDVNHVIVVDFETFPEVIDSLGGITIDVPSPIVSNRFDCPYSTPAECTRWPGWRFAEGEQKMDGRRALIYSRVRENRLDEGETDFTRGERQQQVVRAVAAKTVSPGTLYRIPVIGDDLAKPLATDLSAWELVQLGWVEFRASETLRCRLGGTPSTIGNRAYIIGSEENVSVIAMVEGEAAPQEPNEALGPFAPGCFR